MKHHTYKSAIKKLPETSEIEIKSSVSADEFDAAIHETLLDIKEDIAIDGFRKGSAPEKMVRSKIGDATLLAEAAERAIGHAYGHILEAEKIDAIGSPKVSISKISEGNDLEFTITTAILPVIEKLDYKKIAKAESEKKVEAEEVTDEELAKEQEKEPEVTKEALVKAKEYRAKEKKRLALVDALTAEMTTVIPHILIDSELEQMTAQMKGDIERMGLNFADYLKHLKKTESELKTEWRPDAEKRVKLELAIAHIAEAEKLVADAEKVEKEVKHAQEHYKDLDMARAKSYFSNMFLNQAVFEFLEGQK
ncbi:MAG: trigger factor [Candidatus Paceibacterota bacterium]|jgi:FKBP-type peptidyl-prolyl cis-trans isomerase (trigger factor)